MACFVGDCRPPAYVQDTAAIASVKP